jgi:hypothetical protein
VLQATADDPESEETAIAEVKASGLAREGDSFIVMRRFSYGWSEGFKPYRIGDVGAMLRHVAEHGRKIYPGPNLADAQRVGLVRP